MSPDKLFDYIDGNLSDGERAQIDEQLETDTQLQRELAIAREMRRRSRGSREVLGEREDPEIPEPVNPLGRRLITGFAALVFLNVVIGIVFIIGRKNGTGEIQEREAATRRQLESSLQKSAETSLPLPIIADEIRLPAVASDRDRVAENVLLLAQQAGGSAAKAPPDAAGINVVVDIPSNRADEFRHSLVPLAAPDYSPPPVDNSAATNRRTILQVRVGDSPSAPNP